MIYDVTKYIVEFMQKDEYGSTKGYAEFDSEAEVEEYIKRLPDCFCKVIKTQIAVVSIQEEANEKFKQIYEMKLTASQMREEYRNLTGLDNDDEFTDDEIYNYLLEAYFEEEE